MITIREHPWPPLSPTSRHRVGPPQSLDRLMSSNPTKSFQSWVICQTDRPAKRLHSSTFTFTVASPGIGYIEWEKLRKFSNQWCYLEVYRPTFYTFCESHQGEFIFQCYFADGFFTQALNTVRFQWACFPWSLLHPCLIHVLGAWPCQP